jgi:hypothetical protein
MMLPGQSGRLASGGDPSGHGEQTEEAREVTVQVHRAPSHWHS